MHLWHKNQRQEYNNFSYCDSHPCDPNFPGSNMHIKATSNVVHQGATKLTSLFLHGKFYQGKIKSVLLAQYSAKENTGIFVKHI